MRAFADLAPLARLLHQLRKHRKADHELGNNLDTFLQSILAAMDQVSVQAVCLEDLLAKEGLEPLTRRELQILQWLDTDFTNKEIERELVVTSETVKLHTKHRYRKLSMNNQGVSCVWKRTSDGRDNGLK